MNQRKLGAASVLAAAFYSAGAAAADYGTQIYSVTVDPQAGVLHIDGVDLAPANAPGSAQVRLLGQALTIHESASGGNHLEAALPAGMELYPGTGYQLYVSPDRPQSAGAVSADQALFTLYVASRTSGTVEVDKPDGGGASTTSGGGASTSVVAPAASAGTTKNSTSITNWLNTLLGGGRTAHAAAPNAAVVTPNDGSTFTLPYTGSLPSTGTLFSLTNSDAGDAIDGINSSTATSGVAILGTMSSTSAGVTSTAVRGINNASSGGYGVWGTAAGTGTAVYGSTVKGTGVRGLAGNNGTGVYAYSGLGKALYAFSNTGVSGTFAITNTSSTADDVDVTNAGKGRGLFMSSTNTNNTANVLDVSTVGPGVIAGNSPTGNAGNFFVNNTNAVAAGVRGEVNTIFGNGGAAGIHGVASGTGGYGGYFEHTNGSGYGIALYGTTQGQGMVAQFVTAYGAGGTGANDNSLPTVQILQTANGKGLDIISTSPTGSGTTPNTNNIINVVSDQPGVIPDQSQGNTANFVHNNTTAVNGAVRGETNSIFGNAGTAGIYGVASGTGGYAGYFDHTDTSGFGITLQVVSHDQGTAMVVDSEGSGGDPAIFQNGGFNVARIDRTGKGFFNGGTQNSGADLAEFVPVSGAAPQVGDVVEIDPKHPNRFRLCAAANTTRVAGIISTAPGVTLNARNSATAEVSGPALALAGRVPTKVTNQNGAIHIGDLLVASSQPGRAMRAPAHPRPGTVIGKALQDSDAAQGSVEVLVMLR